MALNSAGIVWLILLKEVQISFCKYILGVGKAACNEAILGEVGRLPMSTTRYPFACYKMLTELDDNGRHTWA